MVNKKILLFILLGILVLSFASADLTDNIHAYYKHDSITSNILIDELGNQGGIGTGVTLTISGLINSATVYTLDHVDLGNYKVTGNDDFTICGWFKPDSATTSGHLISQWGTASNKQLALEKQSSGKIYFILKNSGANTNVLSTHSYTTDWNYVCGMYNSVETNISIWMEGEFSGNTVASWDGSSFYDNSPLYFGKLRSSTAANYNGDFDEWGIWNRTLSAAEILELYNEGAGLTYPFADPDSPPEITLTAPTNDSIFAYPSVIFSAEVTDDIRIQNVSLLIDGIIDQTNTSNFNGTYTFTKSLSNGEHNWSILAFDNASQSTESETRVLEITIIPPVIELSYPPNNLITSQETQNYYAYVYDNLGVENVSIYFDGSLDQTDSSGLNATNYSFIKTLTEGPHTWYIEAYDNDSFSSTSETRNIYIDKSGPVISIESPIATYRFLDNGDILDLNFTVTDINLDTCISEYNGVNTTRPCSSGIKFETTFPYSFGNNNITIYANDTAGNWNSETVIWNIQLSEIDRIFNVNVVQTSRETFIYSGGSGTGVSVVSGKLWYNGVQYIPITTKSGDLFNLTNILEIPSDIEGTVQFFWEVVYQNSTGTFSFNTTNSNQTVFSLSLEECSAPLVDGLTLNFTTYDSTNLTALDSTFEATFQFYAQGGSGSIIIEYLFSDLNENRSNYMFCLNSSGENVTLDAFISYDATDFDRREYILDDAIIGNFTQSIPLFLTETDLTDIVTITVQDQSYDPIAGALVNVQTWNVGTNTYSTIGMLTTSSSGQGIIDLELYTTWYRSVVSIGGDIVEVTDVQKLSGTSWIITVALEEDNPYDLFGDVLYGLTFENSTNITSFTWVDASGYTKEGCMVIKNNTNLGPVTIFDSCVESVSGTIDYLISGNGDYTAYGIVFLEGYGASQIVDTINIRLGTPTITKTVSKYGKVITFLMVGVAGAIGVAAGSIILGSFLLITVLFAAFKFGFLNITSGFIWGIVSILLIAIFIQKRKRG